MSASMLDYLVQLAELAGIRVCADVEQGCVVEHAGPPKDGQAPLQSVVVIAPFVTPYFVANETDAQNRRAFTSPKHAVWM